MSGPVEASGELSVELDGQSPIACEFGEGFTSGSGVLMSDFVYEFDTCDGGDGILGWEFMVVVPYDGTTVELATGVGHSPHGSFDPTSTGPAYGTVVNGSATTPTQIVFDDAVIGRRLGSWGDVSITGAVDITTPTGGLVTYE